MPMKPELPLPGRDRLPLRYAATAMNLFRTRRDNPDQRTQRWFVREYIAFARMAGFRGSVIQQLGQGGAR
jgi:hypothetical protein